uniref:Secreted protein n=1 Tax=Steinernema glaseri TaxID=37863 RepID=A0A1I8AKS8_9BILA
MQTIFFFALTVIVAAATAMPYMRYVPMERFEDVSPDVHTYTINRLLAEKDVPSEVAYVPISAKRSHGFLNLNLNNDIGRFLTFLHPSSSTKSRRSQ